LAKDGVVGGVGVLVDTSRGGTLLSAECEGKGGVREEGGEKGSDHVHVQAGWIEVGVDENLLWSTANNTSGRVAHDALISAGQHDYSSKEFVFF
jgi:hypothetical protein